MDRLLQSREKKAVTKLCAVSPSRELGNAQKHAPTPSPAFVEQHLSLDRPHVTIPDLVQSLLTVLAGNAMTVIMRGLQGH
jgi:hypothetical protein